MIVDTGHSSFGERGLYESTHPVWKDKVYIDNIGVPRMWTGLIIFIIINSALTIIPEMILKVLQNRLKQPA